MPFLAALLLAAAPESEVKLKPVRLDAPCWSWLAPALAPLKEGQVQVGGTVLTVAAKDKALVVSLDGKTATPGAKPAFLGKDLGAVGILKGSPPCMGDEEPAEAFAFLAGALEGKVAGQALRLLDLDGNGSALDFGKDGVLYPGSRCAVPFEARMVVGRSAVAFAVREGRLFAAESPLGIPGGGETEMSVLLLWNECRVGSGLPALEPDPELCEAAAKHAQYLKANPDIWPSLVLNSHDEDPKRPGFSPEGQASAQRSCLASSGGMNNLRFNMIGWLTTLYHKPSLMFPGARKAGLCGRFGYDVADGLGGGVEDGLPWAYPLALPSPWQTTPLRECTYHELPNPMPGGGTTQGAGAFVLLCFETLPSKVAASLRIVEGKSLKEVPAYASSPESPANPENPDNNRCVCLIPKEPLKPLSEYEVDIRYERDGRPCRASWRFFTSK